MTKKFIKPIKVFLVFIMALCMLPISKIDVFASAYGRGVDNPRTISVNTSYSDSTPDYWNDNTRWYKFTLTNPGTVQINLSHAVDNNDSALWNGYLYDGKHYNGTESSLTQIGVTRYTANNSSQDSILTGLNKGTYYVKISGFYNSFTKNYKITIKYNQTSLCEREINDQASLASPMTVNKKYVGTIDNSYDVDYYKFTLSKAGTVKINLSHEVINSSYNYWRMTLYNGKNFQGYDGDLEKIHTAWYAGGSKNQSTCLIGLPAGTYYIKMEDSSHTSIPYYLQVIYTQTDTAEKETNEYGSTATKMSTNKAYTGSIKDSNDIDYYKFTLNSNANIKLNFKHDVLNESGYHWKINLYNGTKFQGYDGDLESMDEWYIPGSSSSFTTSTINLKKGTYFIRVKGHGFTDITYKLSANIQTAPFKLNKTTATLGTKKVGKYNNTLQLRVTGASGKVTWKSSNTKIAKVDANGKVTAVSDPSHKVSTVTITATNGKKTATCKVKVEDPINAFVRRLYKYCFNREAEPGGFKYWTTRLKSKQITAAEAVQGFFESKEMNNLRLTNSNYIERCYLVLMDRKSDAGGKNYWLNQMNYGLTRRQLLQGFVNSKEFTQICKDFNITKGKIKQ